MRFASLAFCAALAALPALAGAPPVRAACDFLAAADGATGEGEIAGALDTLRALGPDASSAAETLAALLPHRAPLWRDRDKISVVRLRAYIVVTLAEIGVPPSAVPLLVDPLAHPDDRTMPVEVGAAARAAATLGPRGRALVPYLVEWLGVRAGEEEFSLARFETAYPAGEATTIQIEAVRALAALAAPGDAEVAETLRHFAGGAGGRADPRVADAARAALARMESKGERP